MKNRISGKYFSDEANAMDILYSPCLKWATRYVRDAGYFNSQVYRIMTRELLEFVLRDDDNHIHLITCIDIYPSDFDAINTAEKLPADEFISQLNAMLDDTTLADPVKMLAALVHSKKMTIYVSLRKAQPDTPHSIDHVKTGYFSNGDEKVVVFDGSMNETYPALVKGLARGNREHFNIWSKEEYSENITEWENFADEIKVRLDRDTDPEQKFPRKAGSGTIIVKIEDINRDDLPSLNDDDWNPVKHRERAAKRSNELFEELNKKLSEGEADESDAQIEYTLSLNKTSKMLPSEMILNRPHQGKALEKWRDSDCRGILQHATGSGKTITAMAAMEFHINEGGFVILVVPNTVLQEQWIEELGCLNVPLNIVGGEGNLRDKNDIIQEIKLGSYSTPSVIIFVKNSFVQDKTVDSFTNLSSEYMGKILFVADECHRVGEPSFSKYIENDIFFSKALGLSATPFDPPEEHWFEDDESITNQSPEERNQQIVALLGEVVDEFSLKNAMDLGYLTRYHYKIITADMSLDEQTAYDDFRRKFFQSPKKSENPSIHNARRIIKSTDDKMKKAAEIIDEKFNEGEWWLVYCATNPVLEELIESLEERGFDKWLKFTSWDLESRNIHLDQFKNYGGVLLTVKCLDEGFNVPKITHGLILASSTKEREFIQRRGRMLRKSNGKSRAIIYDIFSMPHKSASESSMDSILRHELARMEDFSNLSSNKEIVKIEFNKIRRKIKRMRRK